MNLHRFIFKSVGFNQQTKQAYFEYAFDDVYTFTETVQFSSATPEYDQASLEAALFYAWIAAGTSYYKLFPGAEFDLNGHDITQQQADFFTALYRGGLSQFIYENELDPVIIPAFKATTRSKPSLEDQPRSGVLLLQSGGKDSLLAASLLQEKDVAFDAWHMSSTGHHPEVIEAIGAQQVIDVRRTIDIDTITRAQAEGGLNGHVPFSAITAGYALIEAVLNKKQYVIAAMESSSDEGNTWIGDFEVNHMYSKTFAFEQSLQNYIHQNIQSNLQYVSVIRPFTDLRVAELFAQKTLPNVLGKFASCNVANYKQGKDDGHLSWCGDCSKCANSFLLFAPFVDYDTLLSIFDGQNLFEAPSLRGDFLALLGVGGVKPFECVGTVDELRAAYHMSGKKDVRLQLQDAQVPQAQNDFRSLGAYQEQIAQFLPSELLQS